MEQMELVDGQQVRLDISSKNFEKISGYQFTLNFDQSILDYADMIPGELEITKANFGLHSTASGIITTSWNNEEVLSFQDDEILFSLVFNVKSDALVSDLVLYQRTNYRTGGV